jgi:hypothetical protein
MLKNLRKLAKDLDADDVLEHLGLETRRSQSERVVTGLLLFGAGVAVGVGIGMVLAPKAGSELREDIKEKLGRSEGEIKNALNPAVPRTV